MLGCDFRWICSLKIAPSAVRLSTCSPCGKCGAFRKRAKNPRSDHFGWQSWRPMNLDESPVSLRIDLAKPLMLHATAPIESIAFVLEMSCLRFGETPQLARQDLLGISFGAPKLRTESSERRTVKICQDMSRVKICQDMSRHVKICEDM